MKVVVALVLATGCVQATGFEQRYLTRWEAEPVVRLVLEEPPEVNYADFKVPGLQAGRCGLVYSPGERISKLNVPAGDLPPGEHPAEFNLRTPLGAVFQTIPLRIPAIARFAGVDFDPSDPARWPQAIHGERAQDPPALWMAWNRRGLYLLPRDARQHTLRLNPLPAAGGRCVELTVPAGGRTVSWEELAPAGPHLGQVLLAQIDGGDWVDLLFVGSGTEIYFGATPVGGPGSDDQGPPQPILDALYELTGFDLRDTGFCWNDFEPADPGDGPSRYEWTPLYRDPDLFKPGLTVVHIDLRSSWAERYKGTPHYEELAARFLAAFAAKCGELGIRYFSAGFNEPEMFFRSDKARFFVDDLDRIARGLKAGNPDCMIIAGKFSSGDPGLIRSMHAAGFRDNFDVLDIHPYNNDPLTGCAMGEVVASHETLEELGMGHKRIYLGEGWGPTRDLHQVPRSRHTDPVTPAEAQAHRQFFYNGYRCLVTPRADYSPDWVLGAKYFTLNDNVGGTYWAQAARPVTDAEGKVLYYLIGELRFGSPDSLHAFFCNGGLVDFYGRPKGNWFFDFPPSLPEVRVLAEMDAPFMLPGRDCGIRVRVVNAERDSIENLRLGMRHRTGKFKGTLAGSPLRPTSRPSLEPGGVWETAVLARVEEGRPGPLRVALELEYDWRGEHYVSDDVIRTEIREPVEIIFDPPRLVLEPPDYAGAVAVLARNNTDAPMPAPRFTRDERGFRVQTKGATGPLAPGSEHLLEVTASGAGLTPGFHEVDDEAGSGEALAIVKPLFARRLSRPLAIDGDLSDWPEQDPLLHTVFFSSEAALGEEAPDSPFPIPPPAGGSVLEETARKAGAPEPEQATVSFAARAGCAWDDAYFYIAVLVEDEVHNQPFEGLEVWRGDSVQVAVDPKLDGPRERPFSVKEHRARRGEETYADDDYEFAAAATKSGPQVALVNAPAGWVPGPVPGAGLAVRHEGGYTTYEMALPWSALAPFVPEAGAAFGIDLLVNDSDRDEERYTLEWAGAIAQGKFPSRMVPVILEE